MRKVVVSGAWPIEAVGRDEHLYILIIITVKMEAEYSTETSLT
jgi:hypothetical protein